MKSKVTIVKVAPCMISFSHITPESSLNEIQQNIETEEDIKIQLPRIQKNLTALEAS